MFPFGGSKRACSNTEVPSTKRPCTSSAVLTNPSLVSAIKDYSASCLDICPELYDVYASDVWHRYSAYYDDQSFGRIMGKSVNNGFVVPDLASYEEFDMTLGCYKEVNVELLVACAKSSVTDYQALYRALQVRQKLAEFATAINGKYRDCATGHGQCQLSAGPILFQPTLLVSPAAGTWGRADLVKIFQNPNLLIPDDGIGVPDGFRWHFWNITNNHCALCAAIDTIDTYTTEEKDMLDYPQCYEEVTDIWTNIINKNGLEVFPFMPYPGSALRSLMEEKDDHAGFCATVVRPLKALLEGYLSDVKLLTVHSCDRADQSFASSFAGGLTTDGYLVGIYFGFEIY
ncbi:hypothetical protein ACHHYP_06840 [Achlya hypogyna]|uniref:Uncharacterized protein n=1 Tax=Achlya hypogyna TaxID=1202772 RepID=A0A1V9YRH5_ACHHY|nr:hypothetical protein ACHHYP_06840 [Achlya hypogyna]